MRTFDGGEQPLSGRYCSKCGRQEHWQSAKECRACGGALFEFKVRATSYTRRRNQRR